MTDLNAFLQAEAALADELVLGIGGTIYNYTWELVEKTAKTCVKNYAQPEDQAAAAQAVIELVKERLNAIS
jgi:hypothetical protein